MSIKKLSITCLLIIPFEVLASYAVNKNTPENTLAVFEIDGETYYLQRVLLDTEKELIGNGDFYITYEFIDGNYPKRFSFRVVSVHFIPEDNKYKIVRSLVGWLKYDNCKDTTPLWLNPGNFGQFRGYSDNENILETKILNYYLENKDAINSRDPNEKLEEYVMFRKFCEGFEKTNFYPDSITSDKFVIINGVKWATRNIDSLGNFAENPEDAGMFYQWNRKKAWELSDDWVTGWDSTAPTGSGWEKGNDPSPSGWRVATIFEIKSLFDTDKVKNEWTDVNRVYGKKFTDIENGNSIFLPAAGFCRWNDGVRMAIGCVCYWSSTPADSNIERAYERAYGLDDVEGKANEFTELGAYSRALGRLIRCVAK